MLKRVMLVGVLGLAGLVGASGCTGPISAQQDGIAPQDYPQVTVTGYLLSTQIRVGRPQMTPVGNGQQHVTMEVRTSADEALNVDYQYTFLDQNGMPAEPMSGQQFVRIPRKGEALIEFTSYGPAKDFRVELRKAE